MTQETHPKKNVSHIPLPRSNGKVGPIQVNRSFFFFHLKFLRLFSDTTPQFKLLSHEKDKQCLTCNVYSQSAKLVWQLLHCRFLLLLVTWCNNSLTFNNCTLCPHRIYVFCIYLRAYSDLCHLQHNLIGFRTEIKSWGEYLDLGGTW